MLDNQDIRTALIAWLKGNTEIVGVLTSGSSSAAEIRERSWQGEDYLYPNIRVTCSSIPSQCGYSDVNATISFYSEQKSSREALIGQGRILKQMHEKSVNQSSVHFSNMRVTSLPDAVSENGIWKADVVLALRASGIPIATPAAFSPTDVSGLVAWWDFSDVTKLFQDSARTSPVASSSDPIGGVEDKSSASNHLSQDTAGSKPTYITNVKNGLSIARFDGSSDWLRSTFTLNQPCTYYLVLYGDNFVSNSRILDGVTGNAYFYTNTTTQITMFAGSFVGTSTKLAPDIWGVVRIVWNGASSGWTLDAEAFSNVNAGSNNPGGITLGASSIGGNWSDIDVGEMLVFNTTLSVEDHASILSFLNDKWSVY